jgi:hypothetical protein
MKKKLNFLPKITVILPVIDERISLVKTIEILLKENKEYITKIYFILHKKKTKIHSKYLCRKYANQNKKLFSIIYQKKPYLGGAMQDAFQQIKTSHCLMMSSDLETNPHSVKKMIKILKQNPKKIITASRWLDSKQFYGYGRVKVISNYLFQKTFSLLFGVNCTDLTFGFRIFPTKLIKIIEWEMLNHSFLFETIIKPIKLGTKIIEVKSNWTKRIEGYTNNVFTNYFWYIYIGVKVFFQKKSQCIKS